jgi:LysM repeat protein
MHKIAISAVAFAVASASAFGSNMLASNANKISVNKKPASQTVKVAEVKAQQQTKPAAPAPVMVTVAEGDTLSSIAESHDTTYVRIFNANESVADPNVINPGQQLRIPTADEQLAERALPTPAPVVVAEPVKAATPAYVAPAAPRAVAASYPAVSGNDAKAFIYAHESGNNPNATNPSGCYGLGQDCNGRVRALCGADYACQDEFFTNYAMSRYGSWAGALAFWQGHGWW